MFSVSPELLSPAKLVKLAATSAGEVRQEEGQV